MYYSICLEKTEILFSKNKKFIPIKSRYCSQVERNNSECISLNDKGVNLENLEEKFYRKKKIIRIY